MKIRLEDLREEGIGLAGGEYIAWTHKPTGCVVEWVGTRLTLKRRDALMALLQSKVDAAIAKETRH